jgi:hypothetical protein
MLICDNEEEWERHYRKIMAERREFLKREIKEGWNEILKRFVSST